MEVDTQIYNMIDKAKTVDDFVKLRSHIVNKYHKNDRVSILDEIKYMFCEKKIHYDTRLKFISQLYNKWYQLSHDEKQRLKHKTKLCKNFIFTFKRKSRKAKRKAKRKFKRKSKRKSRKSKRKFNKSK